jgi:hypothetical protein
MRQFFQVKEIVAVSATPTDAFAIAPTTQDGSKRQKVCASFFFFESNAQVGRM